MQTPAGERETTDFYQQNVKHSSVAQSLPSTHARGPRDSRMGGQGAGGSFGHQSFFKCVCFVVVLFSARPTTFLFGLLIVGNAATRRCCPSSITAEVSIHVSRRAENKLFKSLWFLFMNGFLIKCHLALFSTDGLLSWRLAFFPASNLAFSDD